MSQIFLLHILSLLPSLLSATSYQLRPHGHVTVNISVPKKPTKHSSTFTSLSITASTTAASNLNDDGSSILLSAFHAGFLNYWSLDANEEFQGASKELCESPKNLGGKEELASYVSVSAFSTSSTEQAVKFNASWEEAELQLGRVKNISLRTGSSKVLYHPPSGDYNKGESYLLSLSSPTDDCFLVAISSPTCPWPDTVTSAPQAPIFGRVLSKGFFPIRASSFNNSFVVAIVSLKESQSCHSKGWAGAGHWSEKKVSVLLEKVATNYWGPVTASVAGIFASAAVTIFLWAIFFKLQLKNNEDRHKHRLTYVKRRPGESQHARMETTGDTELQENGKSPKEEACSEEPDLCTVDATALNPGNILRKQVAETLVKNTGEKNKLLVHRILKDNIRVRDFTLAMRSGDSWHRRQRSKVYLYLVPLLAIFYLIPSAQMVFMLEQVARETNQKCYRNFGCSRPWGIFEDVNHIISNLGYIVYGAAFILMVYLKSWMLPEKNSVALDHRGDWGLAQQHSIFYTMGFSMIMQGIFSCVFHVCPSNISLQFDTTMMYVMLILVFVKLYQFRHPDISAKSFPVMYTLAGALVLEACSLYILPVGGKVVCYVTFCLFYLSVLLKTAFDVYYYGTTKGSLRTAVRTRATILAASARNGVHCLYPKRFAFAVVLVLINLVLMCFFLMRTLKAGPQGLSSPILVICAANVTAFLLHYIGYKFLEVVHSREREAEYWKMRLCLVFCRCFCVLFALGLAAVAMMYYLNRHQSRNLTSAESRNMNEVCSVMDFFDNHDMWHFFSSTALFLTFIFLLTIDDDTLSLDRGNIRVF